MRAASKSSELFVSQLCPSCGLCCNGVLFADVELMARDRPQELARLGLTLEAKGRKHAFPQPCACFDGKLCGIYANRPTRCRTFVCGVLKRVQTGQLTPRAALARIDQVLKAVASIRTQLRALGNREEDLPLTRRYAKVMSEAIDLAHDEEVAEQRARLMLDVDRLMKTLHREFLQ